MEQIKVKRLSYAAHAFEVSQSTNKEEIDWPKESFEEVVGSDVPHLKKSAYNWFVSQVFWTSRGRGMINDHA